MTPQPAPAVAAYLLQNPLPFPLLTDKGRVVARAYGVNHPFGFDFSFLTARPSTFLIDRERAIRLIYVASHQWDRPDLEGLMEAVANLGGTN